MARDVFSGGADVAGGGGGSGSVAPSVAGTTPTNLGATQNMALSASQEKWLNGTLNTNLVVTLTSFPAGSRGKIFGVQDATGNRSLTVTDGVTPQVLPIPTTAGAAFIIEIECPDGAVNFIASIGANTLFATQHKVLTADMTAITSNATTPVTIAGTDGSSLGIAMTGAVGEIWTVKYRLNFITANAAMDAKFTFSFPAGMTAEGGADTGAGVTIPGYGMPLPATAPTINLWTQTSTPQAGGGTAIRTGAGFQMMVYGGGTAGTWNLQVMQNAFDAGALQILKGSMVEYARIV